jgi:DNA-binding Lrp family transcriptional regulator
MFMSCRPILSNSFIFPCCRDCYQKEVTVLSFATEISKLPDIKEVRGTYGVHDVFVKVKSDNTEAMNHTITNKIRKIPGITSTVTLVVIDEQGGKEST